MTSAAGKLSRTLYVSNIPWTVCRKELEQYFSQFGETKAVRIVFDTKTGFSKGFGFVTFHTPSVIDSVLRKQDHKLEGRTIAVEESQVQHALQDTE